MHSHVKPATKLLASCWLGGVGSSAFVRGRSLLGRSAEGKGQQQRTAAKAKAGGHAQLKRYLPLNYLTQPTHYGSDNNPNVQPYSHHKREIMK